ncbi:MAG: CD3337/EF1877 family mobilome membrane protein [Candidatus Pristimantibacillus sp.]
MTIWMKVSKRFSKKTLFISGSILLLLIVFILPVTIGYAQSLDQMIPSDGNNKAIYNQFGVTHYSFQTVPPSRGFFAFEDKAGDTMQRIMDMWLSGGFLLSVWVTQFLTFIARQAFTFSFINDLIDAVGKMISSVMGISGGRFQGGLWNSLAPVFLTIAGFYVLFQIFKARFIESIQTMISFILVIAIIVIFASQAGFLMKKANEVGNSVQDIIYQSMAYTTGLDNNTGKGIEAISSQVWNEQVIRPYNMLQFDSINVPLADTKKVLATAPYSDERKKVLEGMKRSYPGIESFRFGEQFLLILLNFIFSLFISGFFIFWSLSVIYHRFRMLVHGTAMSVSLLGALLPGRAAGLSVIRDQFLKLLGSIAMIVLTGFFLNLSLVLGHVTFNIVSTTAGWFVGMIAECIMVVVIFKYRNGFGNMFNKALGNAPQLKENKSVFVDALKRNATRSMYSFAQGKVGQMFNKHSTDGVPATFNPQAMRNAKDNVEDATSSSMMLRYQNEKTASEDMSKATGNPVQYTPFVRQVNDNLQNNMKNPFRGLDKEWTAEKTRLSNIKKDGGDLEAGVLSQGIDPDMSDQEVASHMYLNEKSIREAGTFMSSRPQEALHQMSKAQVLNRSGRLNNALNDYTMDTLFQRYKKDQRQSIQTSEESGQPIQHTPFVKEMDKRFVESGLNSNHEINQAMGSRKKRIRLSPQFESMPEFKQQRMTVLKANEALTRVPGTQYEESPVQKVNNVGPINTQKYLDKVPYLATAANSTAAAKNVPMAVPLALSLTPSLSIKQNGKLSDLQGNLDNAVKAASPKISVPSSQTSPASVNKNMDNKVRVNVNQSLTPELNVTSKMGTVRFNDQALKSTMDSAANQVRQSFTIEDRDYNITESSTSKVAVNLKQQIKPQLTHDLKQELNHLQTMKLQSNRVATVNKATNALEEKVKNSASLKRDSVKKKQVNID